jgi:HPt (histidine-containing phosphotransfer) domain-containing protein
MTAAPESTGSIEALRAAVAAKRKARIAAEAHANDSEARMAGAEATIAHLKLVIAKLRRGKFDASPKRGRNLLDQLELKLGELSGATAEHLRRRLVGLQGILQADAYSGFREFYATDRSPVPVTEAACWAYLHWNAFELADRAPLAPAAVQCIDFLFDTERQVTGTDWSAPHFDRTPGATVRA